MIDSAITDTTTVAVKYEIEEDIIYHKNGVAEAAVDVANLVKRRHIYIWKSPAVKRPTTTTTAGE